MKPPPSKWLVAPGPRRPNSHAAPTHGRMQVRARRAHPVAAIDVAVKGGEALLLIAVDVVGQRISRFLDSGEERLEQWIDRWAALHLERAVVASERVVLRRVEGILHAL